MWRMLRKVAEVWCMQSRAYGRANMMGRLSYICKSLGWGEVSQRDMLEWTGGRVLMAICWRCGRSWRNTADILMVTLKGMLYPEEKTYEPGPIQDLTSLRQRLDLPWKTRTDALPVLYVTAWLSINLTTVLLPLLLPSLPCLLLVSSSTNAHFS